MSVPSTPSPLKSKPSSQRFNSGTLPTTPDSLKSTNHLHGLPATPDGLKNRTAVEPCQPNIGSVRRVLHNMDGKYKNI